MRKHIAYLLAAALILTTAVLPVYAANTLSGREISYYQDDNGTLKVYVSLGTDAYGDVVLTVFDKDAYDVNTFANLNDEAKAALIEYQEQKKLTSGITEFAFSMDGNTGYYPYVVAVQHDNTIISGKIPYVKKEIEVLESINNKTATEIGTYLDANEELVFGSRDIYKDSIKSDICTALANQSFDTVEDAVKMAHKVSLENQLDVATSSERVLILSSYVDVLAYEKPEYEIFIKADDTFKEDTVALIKDNFTPEKFYEAVDLTGLKNTKNYTEVKPILTRLNDSTGLDLDDYFDLTDSKAVDTKLVGLECKNGTELQGKITSAISGSGKGTGTGSVSGGRGFGGGGGVANAVEAPIEKKEETSVFTDLGGYDWAKPAIEVLAMNGILNGKGEGVFAPADMVSREELVKMLVAIFEIYDETATSSFDDLKNHWSQSYVASASSYGLVKGQTENVFGVEQPITREDMAVLCYRFMNAFSLEIETAETEDFTDVKSISDYAQEAVKFLKGAKVINGKGDNSFAPKEGCNRAEAAKVVYYLFAAKN